MQAKLWTPGEAIVSSEVPVFFKFGDQSAAVAAIRASTVLPPAFAVTPNGERFIDFIGPYVHWLRYADIRALTTADYSASSVPVADVVKLCAEICRGFTDHATDLVISACTELSSLLATLPASKQSLVPPKLALTSNFLLDFAVDCFRPLECGPPFIHHGTSEQHKSWWTVQAAHIPVLARIRKRLTTDFGSTPSGLLSLGNWIQRMDARLRRFHAAPVTPALRQQATREASAYCAALAERQLMRGHGGLAILLLHRATDLLMLSLCDSHGVLDFTVYGGKYARGYEPTTGGNKITLTNSLRAIGGSLATHASRDTDFYDLNDWRNLLMQTHYMTGLDDAHARAIFAKIRPHLESLSGPDWRDARATYLEGILLTVKDIIDADGSLSAAILPVPY